MKTKRNQKGSLTLEGMLIAAAIVGAIILIISTIPRIQYNMNLSELQSQVSELGSAGVKAKKRRPNYATIDLEMLCDDNYLGDEYCSGTPGQAVNSFGGDLDFNANATNPGLRDITVTLPSDNTRIAEIADTLASQSRERCVQADGCTTLSVVGSTITVTM
ncbi:hypothetical protein OAA_13955 [Vibrio cyclitrophicus 1F175]|nr:hypothetical protein OAA_13955 [Vibrio cyclitrophicus 1F175]